MTDETTTATLQVAVGHAAALEILRSCENAEEIWLCTLLILGILNQTLNRVHDADYSLGDVLAILKHYDEHVPMVEATAGSISGQAIRTVN
jgi:hypothetical protein